jgi:hypothetical protein
MKKPFLKVALIPAVVLLVFASGCNLVESPGANMAADASLVLQEEFCVQFDEYRTSSDFTDDVTDLYAAQILAWLEANDVELDDVCSIFQSGGRIVLVEPYSGHPWDITSKIHVKRTDIYDDFHPYLRPQTVTLPGDIAAPGYNPSYHYRGVRTINRALEDLVDGGNPTLSFWAWFSRVDPEPSEVDPLVFSWDACIEVTVVVGDGTCPDAGDDDDDDSYQ